jgi:hypothetical protein
MLAMREAPRSGQNNPEPARRKCGATSRRSICSSPLLTSANTAHEDEPSPASRARTSMRRTMPSLPGAVDTCTRSSGWRKNCTAVVRSRVLPSSGTDAASRANAGTDASHDKRTAMTRTAIRRANNNQASGKSERFANLLWGLFRRDKPCAKSTEAFRAKKDG